MNHDVFVCFSSKDRVAAEALYDGLNQKGIRCWIATRDVPFGTNYQEQIVRAIGHCKILLLVFTEHSNESIEVPRELSLASQFRKSILPLKLDHTVPSFAMQYILATSQWLDWSGKPREQLSDSIVAVAQAAIFLGATPTTEFAPKRNDTATAASVAAASHTPSESTLEEVRSTTPLGDSIPSEQQAIVPAIGDVSNWTDCERAHLFEDGRMYRGYWRRGQPDGTGTMVWPDGGTYAGQWQGGQRHGQGTFTRVDGVVQSGLWEQDWFVESSNRYRLQPEVNLDPSPKPKLVRVLVPDIGELSNVEVVEILVRPGQRVDLHQPLITVESDRVSLEIPSSVAGVVHDLNVTLGAKVSQGSLILLLAVEGSKPSVAQGSSSAEQAPPLTIAVEVPTRAVQTQASGDPMPEAAATVRPSDETYQVDLSVPTGHQRLQIGKLTYIGEVRLERGLFSSAMLPHGQGKFIFESGDLWESSEIAGFEIDFDDLGSIVKGFGKYVWIADNRWVEGYWKGGSLLPDQTCRGWKAGGRFNVRTWNGDDGRLKWEWLEARPESPSQPLRQHEQGTASETVCQSKSAAEPPLALPPGDFYSIGSEDMDVPPGHERISIGSVTYIGEVKLEKGLFSSIRRPNGQGRVFFPTGNIWFSEEIRGVEIDFDDPRSIVNGRGRLFWAGENKWVDGRWRKGTLLPNQICTGWKDGVNYRVTTSIDADGDVQWVWEVASR
jgi:hypothetical protein